MEFERKITEGLETPDRLRHMREAFRSIIAKQAEKGDRIPDLDKRKERLRAARKRALEDPELHRLALDNLEGNGFRIRFAPDAGDAVGMIREEMGDERLLAKSKSNLAKEIGLTKALTEAGIEVIETDIGDRILQLSGEETVHPTGPCAHLDRHDIARILEERFQREIEPEPHQIIEIIRDEINGYLDRARIGLTGVNAITAQEGAVVLLSNEGNIDLVSLLPEKHIMLASVDKIYADLEEAINMVKIQSFYATGEPLTSFVRIITGPSKTADIEKQLFKGVHGPKELVLIMVDNGRSETLKDERGRRLLYCIGCGACLLDCPPYDRLGPLFGRHGRLGGVGACVSRFFSGAQSAADSGLSLCATCGACVARCPVEIDIPLSVEDARRSCVEEGVLLPEHMFMIDALKKENNVLGEPKSERGKWAEGLDVKDANTEEADVLFFAGCRCSYDPDLQETARGAVRLLQSAGLDLCIAGSEESCCGGRALKLGYSGEALNFAEDMAQRVRASGATTLVTPCSDCYATFRYLFPRMGIELHVEILHITELLDRLVKEGRLSLTREVPLTVTYHDPCNLGRMGEPFLNGGNTEGQEGSLDTGPAGGIYDPPRNLLSSIPGLKLVEMERTREHSWCCGAGGGVLEAYPQLASWTATERIEEALSTGASALVTACPWCERTFRDTLAETGADLEVYDVCDLVLRAVVI